MVNKVKISHPYIDYIQSELEIACVEINDGHVWKDLNIPSRILKTCSICGVRNVWPWITTIKCKECKMVCHRQCLAVIEEKICPLLVNHYGENVSTISKSNNESPSAVMITGEIDDDVEVAIYDYDNGGCYAKKSSSASNAALCPLVDRPRSRKSCLDPKHESPFLLEDEG
ncbi:uncharacterized protein LOC114125841 isoform X1 [Aphis gossypii]|uniref:Phorbol-ester/DAG-type domain-containing protein n=1 Tax=Aphis gossypii TaxID=80765 RepID=A0A9P0NIW3_APHGO|nr:uncharacterized protein LOC114125841 isoform X1 [Aphis gossypii]CAH1720946.1 unnamed protein product [Aphis gossypii]